jgi:heptosyltransferase-3
MKPLPRERIRRILAVKLKKIGDVVLTVPALRAIRESYPEAHLAVLVNGGTEAVLEGLGWIDEVIVFDRHWKRGPVWRRAARQIAFLQDVRRRNFDLVIQLTKGDRGAIAAIFSRAPLRAGVDPEGRGFPGKRFLFTHLAPAPHWQDHDVEYNLAIVRALGMETSNWALEMTYGPEDAAAVERLLAEAGVGVDSPLVHIHPACGWLFNCWTVEGMARLIDHLQAERGCTVVITCGSSKREQARCEQVLARTTTRPVSLIGRTTLKQLAALSARATLFVSGDTAPMHIAAAVGTSVVAIFGPAGPFNTGPWGRGHRVITKGYACQPCGQDGCGGSKRSDCLEDLTPEEVIPQVDEALDRCLRTDRSPA